LINKPFTTFKRWMQSVLLESGDCLSQSMNRLHAKSRFWLPGQSISLRHDKETRTFLFTGQWQKIQAPAKDFVTKQEIPGKTVTRYRFPGV